MQTEEMLTPQQAEQEANKEVPAIIKRAETFLEIKTEGQYQAAGGFLVELKTGLKKVGEWFDNSVEKAKASYDEAKALRGRFKDPLEAAEKRVKSGMQGFVIDRNRKQAEAEAEARAKAKRQEEESRLSQAGSAAAGGDYAKADAILNRTAPAFIPPIPKPEEPKGISSKRTKWEVEVFDILALCKAIAEGKADIGLVMPNEPNLRAGAKTKGVSEPWPGVRATEVPIISARG